MKVLLYTEGLKTIGKSGLGKAIKHQMKALEYAGVPYTLDLDDDYDILHINTFYPKSYFLAKEAKRKGKRIVYHAHSTEEDMRNSFVAIGTLAPGIKKWLVKCYKLGDVIVTPTPYSKGLLQNYKGLENKKIYDVSNGIEIDYFKKDKKLGEKFRKDYGFGKDDKVIMGIGLYIKRKGIIDFIELARRMPEYKFIWFGYSPLKASTKDVRDAFNSKPDNIIFPGYVEQDVIRGAMNGVDLYIFPTLEETEGIPIIEACACKTPAIVRDIPIFDKWLEHGKNVYKAKDVDEFEVLIKKYLNEELPDLTEKAYEVAKERDLKIIGEKLKKIYEEVINEK